MSGVLQPLQYMRDHLKLGLSLLCLIVLFESSLPKSSDFEFYFVSCFPSAVFSSHFNLLLNCASILNFLAKTTIHGV